MQGSKKLIDTRDDRAVSPVIGVILMVAITVILAAVIGTFVLGLSNKAKSGAPSLSVNIQDADDAYAVDGSEEQMFRMSVNSISERVPISDMEIRIITDAGTTHTFLGQNVTSEVETANMTITYNGNTPAASDEISAGDVFIVSNTTDGENSLPDDTEYTIQFVYTGGDKPKVVSEAEVRLQ